MTITQAILQLLSIAFMFAAVWQAYKGNEMQEVTNLGWAILFYIAATH